MQLPNRIETAARRRPSPLLCCFLWMIFQAFYALPIGYMPECQAALSIEGESPLLRLTAQFTSRKGSRFLQKEGEPEVPVRIRRHVVPIPRANAVMSAAVAGAEPKRDRRFRALVVCDICSVARPFCGRSSGIRSNRDRTVTLDRVVVERICPVSDVRNHNAGVFVCSSGRIVGVVL